MSNEVSPKNFNFKGWYIVLLSAFMGCTISAAFPQFSMTVTELSLKTGLSQEFLLTSDTIKSASIVVAMLLSGVAYKRIGAHKTFIFALFATVLPQFLLPFVEMPLLIILLKILQGLSSIIFPVFLVIILNWIEERQAGISTAIFNGIFYGGGGIGGTFAGVIIAKQGWVASYFVLGIVQIIVGLIWLFTVKEQPQGALKETDAIEKIENEPKINFLTMPKVWLLAIAFFATTWTVQAITVDMPLLCEFVGYDALSSGKLLMAVTIGMITACIVSGKISDLAATKMQNKSVARLSIFAIGCVLIIASILLLILADLTNFYLFFFVIFMLSFGASWGLGTFYSILPEMFDKNTLPLVTGFTGGVGDIGMPLAPLVVGVAFGSRGLWNVGFGSCAVIAAISVLAILPLLKSLQNKEIKVK